MSLYPTVLSGPGRRATERMRADRQGEDSRHDPVVPIFFDRPGAGGVRPSGQDTKKGRRVRWRETFASPGLPHPVCVQEEGGLHSLTGAADNRSLTSSASGLSDLERNSDLFPKIERLHRSAALAGVRRTACNGTSLNCSPGTNRS